MFSCQEIFESPKVDSDLQDLSSEILPPELDPTGRISIVSMISFFDFRKNHHREDLDLFKDKFASLRMKNEELAKNVKVKSSESCHYIKDGSSEKEIQIVTNFDS